jgi:hypothetical protein
MSGRLWIEGWALMVGQVTKRNQRQPKMTGTRRASGAPRVENFTKTLLFFNRFTRLAAVNMVKRITRRPGPHQKAPELKFRASHVGPAQECTV